MKALPYSSIPLLLGLAVVAGTAGCATTIAYIAVQKSDGSRPVEIEPDDVEGLAEQERITVTKLDGTALGGKYLETRYTSPEIGASVHALDSAQDAGAQHGLEIGDTIRVDVVAQPERKAIFLGVQETDSKGPAVPAIRFRAVGWQMDHVQPMSAIESIKDSDGDAIDPIDLARCEAAPRVMILRCDAAQTSVPMKDIASIRGRSARHGEWIVAGLVVDAAIAYVALTALKREIEEIRLAWPPSGSSD
jgi:hypothetical protein